MAARLAARRALRGVVFDMDGTLTVPNLDFGEMYRRAGVARGDDILSPRWRTDARASAVVEEMEEEGRRTLRLMPGAAELAHWLHAHAVPLALVTRNSARTVDHFMRHVWPAAVPLSPLISRDSEYPAKPDPSALQAIAHTWGCESGPELIMVGDSPAHDVGAGKAAGMSTALLDHGRRHSDGGSTNAADYVVGNLAELAQHIHKTFNLHSQLLASSGVPKAPVPMPTCAAATAAVADDVSALQSMGRDSLAAPCPTTGNSPLIWAADAGNLRAVQALLSAGVSLDHQGYLGATAVCRAACRGHTRVLESLLEAGASPDVANAKRQFPLHFAAFKRHPEAVGVLLERGANPLVLDRKGRTPAEDTSDGSIRGRILEHQRAWVQQCVAGDD
jgi:phosphoglycolate phosphatase-like HAD superfamily hydrolase